MALSDTHQASIQYDTCSINSIKYQNNDLRADTVKKSPAHMRKIHMRKIPWNVPSKEPAA
jgi:hypothetical protein